jgi:hypothetical protein
MRIDYLRCFDAGVFLNFRLLRTRFKRNLLLFCGVGSEGKTLILAVAFLRDETV